MKMSETEIKIKPRCLTYKPKSYHKPAAYTADGYMLPCCWLDDPKNDYDIEERFKLKEEHLALDNVEKIEDIYGSKEWEHFFDTLINNPSCAMKQCQYKCGNLFCTEFQLGCDYASISGEKTSA